MSTLTGSQSSTPHPEVPGHRRPGVILVAHGSARSAASAEPVLALAEGLRLRGFPEVRSAFWKEEPFLHQALDLTRSDTIAVLPVFLSEGYFSSTVVPSELGLRYGSNRVGERWIHLLPPLGAAAELTDIVAARAQEGLTPDEDAGEALLVVIGHGTQRDTSSADAVLEVVASLDSAKRFARVVPAFIDQEPRFESVLRDAQEPVILLVPFLVAAGWHGGATLPGKLDPATASKHDRARRIVYTEPVGTHPALLDLAEAKLLAASGPHAASSERGAPGQLTRLEPFFEKRLARSGSVVLLQVSISGSGEGGHELRHIDDQEIDSNRLTEIETSGALGTFTRRRGDGEQRPLRTTADLPRGWRLRAARVADAVDALVEVYGSSLLHWYQQETDELSCVSFREATAGQTGIYAALAQATPKDVEAGVRSVCDGLPCLRTRVWEVEDTVPQAEQRHYETAGTLVVPCPQPCRLLYSAVVGLVDDPPSRG